MNVYSQVSRLRVTADVSHWVVVCERLLDLGEEDKEILDILIPHVSFVPVILLQILSVIQGDTYSHPYRDDAILAMS